MTTRTKRIRADRDERPCVEGSRVSLAGDLCDGPEGTVVRVLSDDIRVVLFDGDKHPTSCTLHELRRLP